MLVCDKISAHNLIHEESWIKNYDYYLIKENSKY